MLDHIRFEEVSPEEIGEVPEYSQGKNVNLIILNDREIVDILKEIELPYAKAEGHENIAGRYGHLTKKLLTSNLSQALIAGTYENEDGAELLCCHSCGDSGCWSVKVMVEKDEKYVYWKSFHHNHREWAYGISYTFDRKAYEAELT